MKKFLILLILFIITPVYAAQIVNVEYIHNAIANRWDITIPYNPALTNPRVAANMKYLLSTIDVANEMLNGEPTTYGTGEYATTVAVDTVATDTAVDILISKVEQYKLTMIVAPSSNYWEGNDNNDFAFGIGAAGTFYVDWGDGAKEVIEKPDPTYVEYRHVYPADGEYQFRLNGLATQYGSDKTFVACAYSGSALCYSDFWVHNVQGCLGCIFPTLADGTQPKFFRAFMGHAFLTGELPAGFFAGIHGQLQDRMFAHMFQLTAFTSIGSPLFDDLSGGMADKAFFGMFHYCSNLTGESAKMKLKDGTIKYLYEVYPDATYDQVGTCYYGASGLSDYANMPSNWKNWDI